MIALISLMPLSALTQTSKFTTVAVAHSYSACSKIYTRGFYNGGIAVLPHHRSIRRRVPTNLDVTSKLHYSRFLKSSATTRTLLGSSSLTLLVGQRGVHNGYPPEVEELYHGNKAYIANMSQMNPGLLKRLADKGQSAFLFPFSIFFFKFNTTFQQSPRSCWSTVRIAGAHSRFLVLFQGSFFNPVLNFCLFQTRVNEQGIFSARPGTIFTARNIANQFDEADPSSYVRLPFFIVPQSSNSLYIGMRCSLMQWERSKSNMSLSWAIMGVAELPLPWFLLLSNKVQFLRLRIWQFRIGYPRFAIYTKLQNGPSNFLFRLNIF